jgi:hemerythrin-like domain-containing protein
MTTMTRNPIPILALALAAAGPLAAADGRPTASFRAAHAEVKEHLAHLDEKAGMLASQDAAARKETAGFIARFLREHILTHAAWEEKRLYPAVDARTHAGAHPFTATMRYEHRVIERSIGDLGAAAARPELDAVRFARSADRLLGLIAAHFEEEEEVLLPVLDASTTREALEKELGMEAHGH